MEEAKQNIKQKKDSYNLRIVTAVLVLTVLVLGELYVMINYPSNYVALIVLTVVALADIYILIASARTDKESTLKGLQIGADDYISKPYDIDILIAKINGIFKRKYALDEIVCDNLELNNVTQTLTVNGNSVNVTEKEFQLLRLLVENKGTTLKKEYLFNRVWGIDSESELQTLTVHIKWLREKIEQDSKHPEHIITVWGVGYRYE